MIRSLDHRRRNGLCELSRASSRLRLGEREKAVRVIFLLKNFSYSFETEEKNKDVHIGRQKKSANARACARACERVRLAWNMAWG